MGNIPAAQTLNYYMNETQCKYKQLRQFNLTKEWFI
jgi:hypothetical protein